MCVCFCETFLKLALSQEKRDQGGKQAKPLFKGAPHPVPLPPQPPPLTWLCCCGQALKCPFLIFIHGAKRNKIARKTGLSEMVRLGLGDAKPRPPRTAGPAGNHQALGGRAAAKEMGYQNLRQMVQVAV